MRCCSGGDVSEGRKEGMQDNKITTDAVSRMGSEMFNRNVFSS